MHWVRRGTCMHNQSCVFNHPRESARAYTHDAMTCVLPGGLQPGDASNGSWIVRALFGVCAYIHWCELCVNRTQPNKQGLFHHRNLAARFGRFDCIRVSVFAFAVVAELPPEPTGRSSKAAKKAARAQKRAQVKKAKAELHRFLVSGPIAPPARSCAPHAASAAASPAAADTNGRSSSSCTVQDPGTASSSQESSSTQPPAGTAVAVSKPQQPALKEWVGRSMRNTHLTPAEPQALRP